jgi:hypothetical protein
MGYRSEVIAAVPIADKLKALDIINDWDNTMELDGYFYMKAHWWKWYDSYDDVSKFENFILNQEEKACLLAIGEDDAIVSQIGPTWDYGIEANMIITTPFD